MNEEKALQTMKKHALKNTEKRRDMISFFAHADGYRNAKQLHVWMGKKYPGISVDTIYRNIHAFFDIHILEQTELKGEKHYRMSCHTDHHHHFICKLCGKTKAIQSCPMDQLQISAQGFVIEGHKFEVYGLCPDCA